MIDATGSAGVIPGTKFYEEKEKFEFNVLDPINHSQTLVLSHGKMSIEDQKKGMMIICAHHLFHTYKICHLVNRYLKVTMGVKHSQICEFFLSYAKEYNQQSLSDEAQLLAHKISEVFPKIAEQHGAELDITLNTIAYAFWDHWRAAEDLFYDFYQKFLSTAIDDISTEQWQVIRELLRFNLLIAPKPGWSSREAFSFSYDVGQFYKEIMQHWISAESGSTIPKLENRNCSYRFTNPWLARPPINNNDWTRAIPARMCFFEDTHQD